MPFLAGEREMGMSLKDYTIKFVGLKEGEHFFTYHVDDEFLKAFEESPLDEADATVKVTFDKKRETFFELTFDLQGTVGVECDRCLDQFQLPFADQQKLYVTLNGEEDKVEEADEDEIVVLPPEAQQINVAEYIYQYLVIQVPMRRVCEDVEKPCNPEMEKILDKMSGEAEEDEEKMDPRWKALKDLKGKNKN